MQGAGLLPHSGAMPSIKELLSLNDHLSKPPPAGKRERRKPESLEQTTKGEASSQEDRQKTAVKPLPAGVPGALARDDAAADSGSGGEKIQASGAGGESSHSKGACACHEGDSSSLPTHSEGDVIGPQGAECHERGEEGSLQPTARCKLVSRGAQGSARDAEAGTKATATKGQAKEQHREHESEKAQQPEKAREKAREKKTQEKVREKAHEKAREKEREKERVREREQAKERSRKVRERERETRTGARA